MWLANLERTGAFPCEWLGLATVEGWVAQYGDVVGYYLHDWHERLMTEVAQFAQMAGTDDGTADHNAQSYAELRPVDVEMN
jgi:hypothetical protein